MIPLAGLLDIGGKLIDKLVPDPAAKAKAQLDLATLAQNGELASMANEAKLVELANANMDSARNREAAIATSDKAPMLNKLVTPILALGVVGLSFVLFSILIFVDVKPEAKDILIYILGVLSAAVTQILSYYFGSSQGSKDKSEEAKLKGLLK
jgi:hypothetical protein